MKFLPAIVFGVAMMALVVNCTPELSNPDPQPGDANFTTHVAIGGDFIAGYQDGSLTAAGQTNSIPALLSLQFASCGGGVFHQNLIGNGSLGLGWNSKPWESWYIGASHLGDRIDCEGTVSLGPLKDSISRNVALSIFATSYSQNNNWGIPFANIADFTRASFGVSPTFTNTNPYYHRIASMQNTSTVLQDAVNVNATFFTSWLGMEDIFNYARNGGEGVTIASSAQFGLHLDTILGALTANGAKGVIANIPDFRYFPYYTLVPWNGADLTQSKADSLNDIYDVSGLSHIRFHEGSNGFVINDPLAPSGVRQIRRNEFITLGVPLDSMKCNFMGVLFSTIPDRYVLDSSEVAYLDQMIAEYNMVIAQKAQQYNLAYVDMNAYFRTVHTGIVWDGVEYNTTFVSGGFFSLDGYHPNQKGYALIANEFIYAINAKYNATVPTLNVWQYNGVLFP